MTKTIKHSYQVQQGCDASEMATRRNRSERTLPTGPDVTCFPSNEWGFLRSGVKHFKGQLIETLEEHTSLNDDDTRWVCDRLVEANMLIDLIEGPEFRRGYLDWCESVSEELEAIYEKQAPKLL